MDAGRTLAQYHITAKLGTGGMGEVWLATDTRLGREVALKFLPEAMAHDRDRLARFEREARLLASLNHPKVGAIYGLELHGDTPFLVLELIPGATLAERLRRGPLEIALALTIAAQLAEGLEAAHDKGIIHRDLKPANIKVTPDGSVKVLDFGLGKFGDNGSGEIGTSHSPTRTMEATHAGVIMGTAAYMSPEQARGEAADRRSDIWAFGCVLYEMLTARRAFAGETASDIMAEVLRSEPDWKFIPTDTPLLVRSLLRRCLQKDPARRLQHIGDARIEIEEAQEEPVASIATPSTRKPWIARAAAVGVVALGAIAWGMLWLRETPPAPVQRFAITVPASDPLVSHPTNPDVTISPDGGRLAYVARHGDTTRLVLRSMDQMEFKPLAGTEGADSPSFSPDGSSLAYHGGRQLKRVPVNGGAAVVIADVPTVNGGLSWTEDDSILYVPGVQSGIWRVPASGGTPQLFLKPDPNGRESGYIWPQLLPNHAGLLFTIVPDSIAAMDDGAIAVRTEQNETRVVLKGGTQGRVLPTGHLVYGHGQALLAAGFVSAKQKLAGNAVPVVEGVAMRQANGSVRYAVSKTGTLVYVTGSAADRQLNLVSVSRQGTAETLATYTNYSDIDELALSPDGSELAFRVATANDDVHIFNLERRITTRFTFEGGDKIAPVWAPHGTHIAYANLRGNGATLVRRRIDPRGEPEPILAEGGACLPSSFSPDGKTLACTKTDPHTGADLWMVRLEGDRQAQPFLRTSFNERSAVFSPDGRWLAYTSNETGTMQVYAVRYPDGGGRMQLSTDGGTEPVWAASGRELFYRDGDRMMAVGVAGYPVLAVGKPQLLFTASFVRANSPSYAVTRDGQHFLMMREGETEPARQLNVVVNWFEELKRRIPVKGK
jgi:serine/threonine protein kinase/Tol biopolymer transport system component